MPFRLVVIGESPDGRGNNKSHFKALVAGGFAQQRLIVMGDAPDEIHGEVATLIGYDVVTEKPPKFVFHKLAESLVFFKVKMDEFREGREEPVGHGFTINLLNDFIEQKRCFFLEINA